MKTLTDAEKQNIEKQVRAQFDQLVSAVNRKDARAWSEHYSKDGFVSTFERTQYFGSRNAWVDTITSYFAERESQHVEPLAVQVIPLASDVALLTSQEKAEMRAKGGETNKFPHVFTMIWRKEESGWKILHSHESWVGGAAK